MRLADPHLGQLQIARRRMVDPPRQVLDALVEAAAQPVAAPEAQPAARPAPTVVAQLSPVALREVVVTATRFEEPSSERPVNLSVIPREAIATTPARTLPELLALQPGMAVDPISTEFLPPVVVDWISRLAAMPAQMHFAGLIESLRETDPELAESLQAQAARDRGLLADLEVDALRTEFEGALNQLRAQGIRDEVDRLAASGLQDEASRLRYAQLLALRKSLSAP
jgi:hypothetical protein